MKRRVNQQIAVAIEMADHTGTFTHDPMHILQPMLLPGGVNTEHNVRAYLATMREYAEKYDPGVKLQARVIYRWRSHRHLMRWVDRGGKF